MKKIIIAAVASNGVIGNKGSIPWHLPEYMKFFKETTMGYPVIMGRRTWESLPEGGLDGRENLVVTRNWEIGYRCHGTFLRLEQAIWRPELRKCDKCFFIGGAQIYEEALPIADEMYITHVHKNYEGDTYFPEFDDKDWDIEPVASTKQFVIYHYRRK